MSERARQGAGRLVAVVVTHNRPHQLRVTLARLLEAPEAELAAVVVVDNASTDGETARVLDAMSGPRLDVVRSDTNLGGAGGFEQGLRRAMAAHAPDWLVVMDDDARPEPGALAAFHARAGTGETALSAAVYYPDGRICEMNRPGVNPFWSPAAFLRTLSGQGRAGYHYPDSAYEGARTLPVDLASFVGLFLPRHVVEAVGLPDGRLFLYGDDVIYALRLRRQGFAIRFDPAVRFEHDCTTYSDDRRRTFSPLWKTYYSYRNGLIMYRRAAGPLIWPLALVLILKWRLAARRYGAEAPTYRALMRAAVADGLRQRLGRDHAEVLRLAAGERALTR